jgi:hypothetical protein
MLSESALWLAVDVAGSLALVAAACFALGVASARPGMARGFWLVASGGLLALAADERFSLHERAGRRLSAEGIGTPFGLNHMDDAVLLLVAGGAVAFVALYSREATRSRRFALLLSAAGVVSAMALAIDGFAPVEGWAPRTEEPVELAGQLLLLAAFAAGWNELRTASDAVQLPAAAPEPAPLGGQ